MFARTAIAGVRLSRVGIRNLATKTKPNNNGFKGLKVRNKVKFFFVKHKLVKKCDSVDYDRIFQMIF